MLPIFILRYIYGGAFAFNEDIAITYVDYADMVARWDVSIDATPPTLVAYTAVENLLTDMYTVYQNANSLVLSYFDTLIYSRNIGAINTSNISQLIDAIQKDKTLISLSKDENIFYYYVTVDGESSFVLNAAYFTGFVNYTDLVDLFNLYSYEQLMEYGYEWIYEVGQFLGETFDIVDARNMLNEVYLNEIKDLTYPLPDFDSGNLVVDTYANIQTLATGSLLKLGNLYQINNNTDAEGGDVILRPISSSAFSKTADYIPSFDATKKWFCIYDFDTGNIIELKDDINNTVIGNSAINNFIWGDSDVSGNYIDNPASLTLTAVNLLKDNIFGKNTVISIDSNGDINNNSVLGGSIFDVTDTGNTIISKNTMSEGASVTLIVDGGTIESNTITNAGILDINNTTLPIDLYYNLIPAGTLTIADSSIPLYLNTFDGSSATITDSLIGAAGNIGGNKLLYSNLFLTNCDGSIFEENSALGDSAYVFEDCTTMIVRNNHLESHAFMQLVNVSGNINGNSVESDSIINNAGAITITGQINRNTIQNDTTVNITTNHAGEMNHNRFGAQSTITAGANGGITHNRNIVAATAHAFVAAVNENANRVND